MLATVVRAIDEVASMSDRMDEIRSTRAPTLREDQIEILKRYGQTEEDGGRRRPVQGGRHPERLHSHSRRRGEGGRRLLWRKRLTIGTLHVGCSG